VTKPSSHGVNTREVVGEDLVRKIKALASQEQEGPTSLTATPTPQHHTVANLQEAAIVAIGVSTGGPNALVELLPRFPADFPVPIVLVQHMPPLFTKMLAERLSEVSKLPVSEAEHTQEIVPGQIYLAPGGFHMEIKRLLGRTVIALHDGPPENSCRPAVDVLFRSVAKVYRERALGVVLTGMGQDGLHGSKAIKQTGGAIIVQDKESSAVWGMPGAIVDAGLDPCVLPLSHIADEIARRVIKRGRAPNRKVPGERADSAV
jgi:two-component system chemotaxis response regulator CheB